MGQGDGGGGSGDNKEEEGAAAAASAKDGNNKLVQRTVLRTSSRLVSVLGREDGFDTAIVVWS